MAEARRLQLTLQFSTRRQQRRSVPGGGARSRLQLDEPSIGTVLQHAASGGSKQMRDVERQQGPQPQLPSLYSMLNWRRCRWQDSLESGMARHTQAVAGRHATTRLQQQMPLRRQR